MEKTNAWIGYKKKQIKELEEVCASYRDFLDRGKTERECVREIVKQAREEGYRDLGKYIRENKKLKAGDKVYAVNMNKTVALFNIGTRPVWDGMRILGAHIDSPRMDVKQDPLYESDGLAYLDTHYYGGIKKYQWVTLPLAIHGVVAFADGSVRDVVIGEDESDPAFCVTDLLIHLASDQMEKKGTKLVEGENLDILVGSRPLKGKDKDAVKAGVLSLLEEKYGIKEEDFFSAELEVVPAGRAREAGLDRSMIMAYGQDDRVCAYTSLRAMLETKDTDFTTCTLLVDKEEIGSVGATGMKSRFFENTVAELINLSSGREGMDAQLLLRRALASSRMLSSDVSAGFDPLYASVFDKKNAAFLGKGIVFNKYTGSRGKSGSNDANAEYLGRLRGILDAGGVTYQSAELGKVDAGGGGTIAYILSHYGMEVVDCGVAVLNMHAPWEVTSKADVYETYRGYKVFLSQA